VVKIYVFVFNKLNIRKVINNIYCWVTGGARGTVHIETRTTTQERLTPHSYPKP